MQFPNYKWPRESCPCIFLHLTFSSFFRGSRSLSLWQMPQEIRRLQDLLTSQSPTLRHAPVPTVIIIISSPRRSFLPVRILLKEIYICHLLGKPCGLLPLTKTLRIMPFRLFYRPRASNSWTTPPQFWPTLQMRPLFRRNPHKFVQPEKTRAFFPHRYPNYLSHVRNQAKCS